MINLLHTPLIKIIALSSAVLLLQACGGEERTTPYNPGTSSSSSSSSLGASVTVGRIIENGNSTNTLVRNEKQLLIMRDGAEYSAITNLYVTTALASESFTNKQVVLIDMGNTDACADQLQFSSISAREAGDKSVKVTIQYTEKAAQTVNCSSTNSRPFHIYYVQSKKLILFEESVVK